MLFRSRLRELPDSFERASHVFAHRYFVNESQFANGIILDSVEDDNREQFDINNVNMKQIDRTKIYGFLKSGDVKQVSYFLEEFLNELGTNALNSLIFRQYITMDIYFCVVSFIESLHFSREEIEPFDISSGIIKSVDTATKYMTRIIQKAFELRNQTASNRYGDVVNEAMKYIEQKFADPELSLILLASHVNFSPNHLSMIFSQQTGKTFIKYLTEFRMNKAKSLVRCTANRNNVISTEVGSTDPQ